MVDQKELRRPKADSVANESPFSFANQANPIQKLEEIYTREGWPGLFAGVSPRLLRALASGAVQFASYEISQNFLNKI